MAMSIAAVFAVILLGSVLVCCGKESGEMKETIDTNGKKVLIACFSRTGNTRTVAQLLQQATGGDLFEIEPAHPYPATYGAVAAQAKKEIKAGIYPELKDSLPNISDYDVIFIGSPNWWNTIAPPVSSFLSGHDLSGKTIATFITHGGSGLGNSVGDVSKICPDSRVVQGLEIYGTSAGRSQKDVINWLEKLDLFR